MKMADNKLRWEIAQTYECNWWKNKSIGNSFYYQHCADEIKDFLHGRKDINSSTNIIEVGSGPIGILTYLTESENRYAIDPLEDYYSTVPEFVRFRDAQVNYIKAKGEDLDFEDQKFDLVIMDNVLDHCESPEKVLDEIKRVIKPGGYIYFKQNTYNYYGKFIRKLMELFLIDKGHPHTFTKSKLKKQIAKIGDIQIQDRTGYFSTWKREIASRSLKDKVKAILFVTRDKVTYFIEV